MENCIKKGNIVKGKVTGIENYGIFVKVDDYDGLIHISEVSEEFVRDVNSYVSMGEIIYCYVLAVFDDEKKIKLSIKDINYKSVPVNSEIQETRLGFLPLKENLENWLQEKLDYYQYKKR